MPKLKHCNKKKQIQFFTLLLGLSLIIVYSLSSTLKLDTPSTYQRKSTTFLGKSLKMQVKSIVQNVSQTDTRHEYKLLHRTDSNSFQIFVHLDLKGAPPRLEYLLQLLPLLKKEGASGLVIEYEDTFPFTGDLVSMKAHNAYMLEEVKQLLAEARLQNLQVVPLIQTFGHLKMALKLPEFVSLRERQDRVDMICPTLSESWSFLKEYIDHLMAVHGHAEYLHIGCDEVFYLGSCARCQQQVNEFREGEAKSHLFLAHVSRVAKYVKSKYKGVQVLTWHDMISNTLQQNLTAKYELDNLVQTVIWDYGETLPSKNYISTFLDAFDSIWAASAFKGAQKPYQLLPSVRRYVDNNQAWLMAISQVRRRKINKIIITGWSRFNHMRPLCELLPVALPSLISCIHVITNARTDNFELMDGSTISMKISVALQFPNFSHFVFDADEQELHCGLTTGVFSPYEVPKFPGGEIYALVHNWCVYTQEFQHYLQMSDIRTALSPAQLRTGYIFPNDINKRVMMLEKLCEKLAETAAAVSDELDKVYDKETVKEWEIQVLSDTLEQAARYRTAIQSSKNRHTWKPRLQNTIKAILNSSTIGY